MNPDGMSKEDDETGAWEKFDFCNVISIKTALVVCVPSGATVVVVVESEGGGVFFLWKPPNAEPPNADPNMPAIEPFELGGAAAGAGSEV